MNERITQFIEGFVQPFWHLEDRPLVVRDQLGPELAQAFCGSAYVGVAQEDFYERLFYKANRCTRTDVPWPHQDALLLTVAAHDVIALADPDLSSRRRRNRLGTVEQVLSLLPALTRRDQLAVRWAALEQLARCARRDTTVRFWAGKRTFRGRDVPRRLVALPRVRRVRTSEEIVRLCDVWPEDLEHTLQLFWCNSPLSWLCNAHRWAERHTRPESALLVAVLRDPHMRAFVAESQRNQDLGWLAWLLSQADAPLKNGLQTLALELRAYGAEHAALSALLGAIPQQHIALFDQRVAKPLTPLKTEH